ncbi:hypothetical protein LOTGIDRAFT_161209 [Lottia gigantea]|uniref:DAGKc domain-containing protein n=1 Tax=Lottia gigantea TaxID=225164 RepID=V4BZD7_LOTGI|nr:hypothetical protein LOTGIDRAFT_161209 [Lottia gigantea]ESO94509.1 hypothetical protein LOTGIDRAFT_161209 [Lottia gigantea]
MESPFVRNYSHPAFRGRNIIMEGLFVKADKKFLVCLNKTHLLYRNIEQGTGTIAFEDILSVKYNDTSFTVMYAVKTVSKKLVQENITFYGSESKNIGQKIQEYIDNNNRRPKQLLVFINPNSGKRRAVKVYYRKVKPIFDMCGIQSNAIVTKKPGEAKEILQKYDLSLVNGIITVGGDGLYCECMTGLVLRAQSDAGIKYDSPEAKIVASAIPIGIIPAGSGDYIVQYLHGTRDVKTAALHVILGQRTDANVVGVHQGGKLMAYSGLLLGFGLFGDIMYDCEKFRWMGASRFNIIPVGTVLRRRAFDLEVEYLPAGGKEWQKSEGTMYGVDTYVVSRVAKKEKMVPHFGDDAMTVYLTSKCSLSKHVKQLAQVQDHKAGCFDHDFVQQHRVDGYKIRLTRALSTQNDNGETVLEDKYYVNCDGEVLTLTHLEIEARFHRNVVQLFGQATI